MTINRDDLAAIDFSDIATGETIPPTHPGAVLRHDFLEPMGLSAYAVAKATGVPANRITAIMHGTRGITADTALRLASFLGTSAEMWISLQGKYDLAVARERRAA